MVQSASVERDVRTLAQLVPQEQVQRTRMPLLDGGFRTDKSPSDLAPNEAVDIRNLNLVAGVLGTDTGYAKFGSPFIGQSAASYQVFNSDGTAIDLLVTASTIYSYSIPNTQWQLVSFGTAYSISNVGGYPVGTTAFTLASVAGLTTGKLFGVGQSDGSQYIGTILTIVGSVVTLSGAGTTQTVLNGAPCALGTSLNGDLSAQTQVIFAEFPANGWTIFSNGVDPIMYYNGLIIQILPGLPTNTTCKAMVVAHEQLLIANTIENGTAHPQRLRASDQADPTNWTTGISAIYDLLDTEDFILSANILGPYVIVYRETTIMRGTYLGLPNQTWFWEYMIIGEGSISQGAVAEIGDAHFFVGVAGLYIYNGSYELESIGDAVFFDFFSALGTLNPRARATVFVQYVGDFDECWVFFPSGANTFPSDMLRVDLTANSWFHRIFANQFVNCQPRLTIQEFTWANTPGLWTDHLETWNSRIFLQNVPNFLLCAIGQQQLMIYDYTTPTDNGVVIAWTIVTRQFGDGATFTRWERLVMVGRGNPITVEYSVDEGNVWAPLGTVSLDSDVVVASAYVDVTATRIQFRLTGADPNFSLRYADVIGVTESEW